ncbi:MAG: LysR substrate-binding domain-containing protein, partial [Brumimicrobium sp.]
MISLTQLNYILNLLKHQNFQAAADASYVTQPTLSMQLKRAEDIIGFKIINRDTNPISLTDSGKKLLPLLLELKNSYDNLEIGIRKLEGTYKAEIRIGIIPTVSNYLVPEFYSKWKKEIHNVSLDIKEVTSEKLIQEVKNKTLDFGIMAGPLEDTSFQQQILFHEEIQIYTSEIEETTISLKQLKGLNPWLLGEDNCLRTQMI